MEGWLKLSDCLFCGWEALGRKPIYTSTYFVAIPDGFPISPGHTLVFPTWHVQSILGMGGEYIPALWEAVHETCSRLEDKYVIDAFNFGVNDGPAAGQTIPHFHWHIIPRYTGDVENPRGGVRNLLPDVGY